MKQFAGVLFLTLLAACATPQTNTAVMAAPGMNDDSNALPGHQAISGNTGIPVGADADAVKYDPVQPFLAKSSTPPQQDSLINTDPVLRTAAIIAEIGLLFVRF